MVYHSKNFLTVSCLVIQQAHRCTLSRHRAPVQQITYHSEVEQSLVFHKKLFLFVSM